MISLHKITKLMPLDDFILKVDFGNEVKLYDLKPLLKKNVAFQDLERMPGLYEQAKIDVGGYGIVWSDLLDLSAETIYQNGISA